MIINQSIHGNGSARDQGGNGMYDIRMRVRVSENLGLHSANPWWKIQGCGRHARQSLRRLQMHVSCACRY